MQFNFMSQFAEAVESYEKPFTIRNQRKVEPKLGEVVHLFTGQRTRHCRKLGVAPLKFFGKIHLGAHYFSFPIPEGCDPEAYKASVIAWLHSLENPAISRFTEVASIKPSGIEISEEVDITLAAYDALAKLDGFAGRREMFDYHCTKGYCEDKWLYAWENPNHHKYLLL